MKTTISSKASTQGTALLVALFLTTILAISIAGYLKHAYQQQYLSMRSQVWNTSIAVTEAGVEEALQHLNTNPTNLSANGWVQSGSTYSVTRDLNSTATYAVTINAANMGTPEITSVAYINSPALAMSKPAMLLATIGVDANVASSDPVSRAVRVKTGKDGLFLKAMVAKQTIDMNGNNVKTDSFNSTLVAYSDNGKYPKGNWSKLLDNGDVASNSSIINAINAGNADIWGHVAVGPGGTVSVGANGGVGSKTWHLWGNNGIQDGWFSDDMNFTFPKIELPYTSGLTPTSGNVTSTNFTYSGSTNTVTTNVFPNPPPATGVISNINYVTVGTLPNPKPYGTVTNTLTTATSSSSFPAAGTYVGTPTKKGSKWYYNKITGYNYTYPGYTYTYTTGTVTTNMTISTVYYDYILEGSTANMPPLKYYVPTIPNGKILVKGNANLVVGNNVKQSGQDGIWILPSGKLEMWVGGTSLDLSGKGVFNQNGYAQNFVCWCTDTVTDVKYAGNGEFTGILVAPNGNLTLNGGGSAVEDFIGAVIANTIKMNGHYSFHYDEALRDLNNNGRYKITEWHEISISQATANP